MSIILASDRLKVEIAEPGVFPNTTTRFDRAGFVTQVTLDGRHQFCSREPDNVPHPPTGGVGLCSEFRSGEPALEAPMGAQFPKLGVGLLTKDLDGRYIHHHRYPCDPFPISFNAGKSVALFDTAPVECMGYAVHGTKKLEVAANELTMTMTVENVGRRPIAFTEYCHNFVTIDRLPIGPDYYLCMPVANQDGKPAREGAALIGRGHGVGFCRYSNAPSFFVVDAGDVTCEAPFTWKLSHANTTASISETVSVLPARIAVWTIDHIVSPEITCHFELAPGESASWTRRWAFDD